MKICKTCKLELDDIQFQLRSDSKKSRTSCRSCESTARLHRRFNPPSEETRKKHILYSSRWQKSQRANPLLSAKYIVKDSKSADKKANRGNDLTEAYIRELIDHGCAYCGNKTIKMTADRIDNTLGHTKENVMPACYRCNMIRGNMPYAAWLNVVPAIRDTFNKGLFDDWLGFGPWSGLHNGGGRGI